MSRRKEQIKIEYDVNYTGGDYDGVGQFVIVTVEGYYQRKDVLDAFRKKTGLDPRHIVHYATVDIEVDTVDNLKLMEKACRPRRSSS